MKKSKVAGSVLLASLFITLLVSSVFAQIPEGYDSAFEGPKVYFHGVKYQGLEYDTYNDYASSLNRYDSAFAFDSDAQNGGKPNIIGEKSTIFIPRETVGQYRDWIPFDWFNDHEYLNNPTHVYEWEIDDELYYMEEWVLRWYVSFTCEYEDNENPRNIVFTSENIYTNLAVWLRFNLEPTWYIQGQGVAYFAIGKISLAHNVLFSGVDNEGHTVEDVRDGLSVIPESVPDPLFLSPAPFGQESAEKTAYSYQGKKLNPDLFTDNVYAEIDLMNFGASAGPSDPLGWSYWDKGDIATFCFDVTVFVIGEWSVQDIEDDPDAYGRFVRQSYDLEGILDFIADMFTSPWGWVIILAVGAVLLLILAPQVLFAFAGSGRKKGGSNWLIWLIVGVVFIVFVLPYILELFL